MKNNNKMIKIRLITCVKILILLIYVIPIIITKMKVSDIPGYVLIVTISLVVSIGVDFVIDKLKKNDELNN